MLNMYIGETIHIVHSCYFQRTSSSSSYYTCQSSIGNRTSSCDCSRQLSASYRVRNRSCPCNRDKENTQQLEFESDKMRNMVLCVSATISVNWLWSMLPLYLQKFLLKDVKEREDSGVGSRKSDSNSESTFIEREDNLSQNHIKDECNCSHLDLSKWYEKWLTK